MLVKSHREGQQGVRETQVNTSGVLALNFMLSDYLISIKRKATKGSKIKLSVTIVI